MPILERGAEVGTHRLDPFVADEIVVELKAAKDITFDADRPKERARARRDKLQTPVSVASFPTIARSISRITSEVWLAFADPVASGQLRSHEVALAGHVICARDAIAHPRDLLEAWLAIPEIRCCTLQVGLQLYVDGALWTGGITDHFEHLAGWASLAESLLDGAPGTSLVAQESSLRSRIEGERAMVWDELAMRSGRTREAWFPIRAERIVLARAISEAGATIDALRNRAIAALDADFDRAALPARLDPRATTPRARERLDKAAVIDREIARRFDTLALRAIARRLASP